MRLLLAVLLLAGCAKPGTKFKVGDCVADKYDLEDAEKSRDLWIRKPDSPRRVIEVGLDSYRLKPVDFKLDYIRFDWESIHKIVPCEVPR